MNWRRLKQLIRRFLIKLKLIHPQYDEQIMSSTAVSYKNIYMTHSGFYTSSAKRSVIFLNNSYYHFYYLAQALRRRDWDVLLVSNENPNQNHNLYYHGEDINLYSPDTYEYKDNITNLYKMAKNRYKLLHFANDDVMSFFPEYYKQDDPIDIIEWKKAGNKIANTVSGCRSGTSQTALSKWSRLDSDTPICQRCPWQNREEICSDLKNLRWGEKLSKYCDVVFAETLPALDYIAYPNVIREPTTMCLDTLFWHPDLEIPQEYRISKNSNEVLIYHAVGNYQSRTVNGKNLKGTSAIFETIEKLQLENFPVRLIFETGKRNKELRYIQAQADIIVDQLIIGRYGATAREAMMLGKPTICYLNYHEPNDKFMLKSLQEVPLLSANEDSLYEVLKSLITDKEKRMEIGRKSRDYALKWHSADACAQRYEIIYDQIMEGKTLEYPQKWNYFESQLKDF